MAKKRTSASSAHADELRACSLGEYIVRASDTGQTEPIHLQPFLDSIAAGEAGKPQRCVVAIPCQHGKTTTVQHAIAWILLRNPRAVVGYATYSKTFSGRNSRVIRRITEASGVQLSEEQNTIAEWQTDEHGGCVATSIDGELTGYKLDYLFVDDPYKNRAEAESQISRQAVSDWMRGVALTRVTPRGSVWVVASRWHQEDLSGELIAKGWDNITLPAINAQGEALCPWGPDPENPRTVGFLNELRKQIGDYDFESLYQGNPKPATGSVFQAPTFGLRPNAGRITVGLDLAYTAGAQADYSAAVALQWTWPDACHVIEVARWRTGPTELASSLRAFLSNYPGATVASFVSGPERAVFSLLREYGVNAHLISATGVAGSKYLRSQEVGAAWNGGRVTIPYLAPWVDDFVREVRLFTGGTGDSHDDQVDALASAFHARKLGESLAGGRPVRPLRR
jgi:predicted phage terminase large subunit-like protein